MSGPSATQLNLQQEQADFYQEGMQESTTAFGEQQALLSQMEAVYDPILAKGPNQEGFSTAEENNLNAQATEGTATNYAGAAKAVNEELASEGGGTNPLPTGGATQLKEEVAASAAAQQSGEENQIIQANYAQGYNEFEGATQALATASGELSPTSYESAATSAGSAAEQTANQINQEENSWEAPVLGAIGAIGGAAAGDFDFGGGTPDPTQGGMYPLPPVTDTMS
jgi:hypothetical protein